MLHCSQVELIRFTCTCKPGLLINRQVGATHPLAVILSRVLGCCRCKRSWVCKYTPGKKASLTWLPPSFRGELLHQYPNSVKLAHQCQVGIKVKSTNPMCQTQQHQMCTVSLPWARQQAIHCYNNGQDVTSCFLQGKILRACQLFRALPKGYVSRTDHRIHTTKKILFLLPKL